MEPNVFRCDGWSEAKAKLSGFDARIVFRGQGDSTWELKPSLERSQKGMGAPLLESTLLQAFKRHAHLYGVQTPSWDDDISWLALMQHHGAPTRLMDWTKSQLVAAYFAALDRNSVKADFSIWGVNVLQLKVAAIDAIQAAGHGKGLDRDSDLGDPVHFRPLFLGQNQVSFVAPI